MSANIISKKKDENWWNEKRDLASKTFGKMEGIAVREELAGAFYQEGMLEEAANMWEEMAKIAEQYPEMEKKAMKYFDVSHVIREEMNRRSKNNEFSSRSSGMLIVMMAALGIMFGILLLSPNFTGSVIASPDISVTNWTGAIFLVIGCIVAVWYMLRR